MAIIMAEGLARTFRTRSGAVEAVRGVDLEVGAGEIVGFLGTNGAGKTTTLRMLATLLRPTSGRATVAGADLRRDPAGVRRRIGYVGQAGGAHPDALVGEELLLQGELYRMTRAAAREQATAVAGRLGLADLLDRQVQTLSGGQRRRLDIALGLVHSPPLVFLDEPSTGLDPHSRRELWDHTRRLRDEWGTTVFLTTHYLEEADALCDRVLVMDRGGIVIEGTPEELKRKVRGDVISVEVADDPAPAEAVLRGRPEVLALAVDDRTLRLTVARGEQALFGLVQALGGAGVRLESIQLTRPSLDEVFLAATGHPLSSDPPTPPGAPAPLPAGAEVAADGPAGPSSVTSPTEEEGALGARRS